MPSYTKFCRSGSYEDELSVQAPDPGDYHLWVLLACEDWAALVTGDKRLLDNPPEGGVLLNSTEAIKGIR
ncbi:MAG: hypothetical protein K8R59_00410 [Thermoanaerobaculales bacterium]|nr:hypothetical protein [Thermoanaerobaculales bacterium]